MEATSTFNHVDAANRSGLSRAGRRPLRIAIAAVAHETNTFAPRPTTLGSFQTHSWLTGDRLLSHHRPANNVLGGMIAAAESAGVTLLPAIAAAAPPGGVVTAEAWATIRDELLDRLRLLRRSPWPLDGVLLALHGAMVSQDEEDADGALLRAVRDLVGSEVPIVATVDSHANISSLMVASADLLVAYRTYPHLDTAERGRTAARLLIDRCRGTIGPEMALRQIPLLAPLPAQRTDDAKTPLAEVIAVARQLAREQSLLDWSIAGGFPYADTAATGTSVLVATDADRALAEESADRLAATIWARRDRFAGGGLDPDQAIDRALAAPAGPVILAETADNPGAGAPGDGTFLLARLLERGVGASVIGPIAAPTAVERVFAAGDGAAIRVELGAGDESLALDGRIERRSAGVFTARGPLATGGVTRLGRTAVIVAGRLRVVLSERSAAANDPELFRSLGIEPRAQRIVAIKSSVHYRAAYTPFAAEMIEVETPGVCPSDLSTLPYVQVRRPIWPVDREVRFLD